MKITTPSNALSLIGKSFGLGLYICTLWFGASATTPPQRFPDTIYIPVIFYDFHPISGNDFETCMNPGGGTVSANNPQGSLPSPNMVDNRINIADRKPVMTSVACDPSDRFEFPCACSLDKWFRPSGSANSPSVTFEEYDTIISGSRTKRWRWTGLTRSTRYSTATDVFYVGPSWQDTNLDKSANLVYYSALPFILINAANGTYRFDRRGRNTPFFWLDGKGFGNQPAGRNHNFAFTMEMHHEFTYQGNEKFDFSGDDDVWVFINNQLVLDLGGVHSEMSAGFSLDTLATRLGLVQGDKYVLDVFYAERHTTESNCMITTNLIRDVADTIKLKVDAESLCPGKQISIKSLILNQRGDTMTQLKDSVVWEIVQNSEPDPNDKLLEKKGENVRLTATKAWRTIEVRASVFDPYTPENILRTSVFIPVIPCEPHHIVIEATESPRKWGDDPLPSVSIGSTDTIFTRAYAVVRDPYENLFDLSKPFTDSITTQWKSLDPSIATVSGETNRAYHGIVKRVKSDTTWIIASDGNLIPDTVIVRINEHYYTELRLIDLKTGKVVDTLKLETDSIGHYKIQGLKSTASDPNDPNSWEDCLGKIDLLDTLKSDLPLTQNGPTWDYSPSNHGRGRVIVSNPNDSRTKDATVPVIIILSPPKLYLNIITDASKLIAGDTILVEATIKNDDGLIPVPYCFGGPNADIKDSIAYFDNLGLGGAEKPQPYTIIENKVLLNFDNERYKNHQCFKNGRDTFGLVLFYAPYHHVAQDSFHVLSAYAGSRYAETKPFKLLPGPLYRLDFENSNYVPYPDTIYMNPEAGTFGTYVDGYDKYGNRRGFEPSSKWSVTGDLDPKKLIAEFGDNNTYRTDNEKDGMTGKLVAEARGKNDTIIRTDLTIIVRTPPSKPIAAYTRDLSGNGLLDRIDIVFNKKTEFSLDDGNISIANISTSTNFSIDNIVPANDGDTLYYVYLQESVTKKAQTGWTPTLMLSNFPNIENVSGLVISDGAAPVVWEASVVQIGDPKKAIVTIVLSERIETGGSQNLVTVENDPSQVFNIWEKVGNDYVLENLLSGIENFNRINGETFEFTMKNGREITDDNYVNIIWENKLIADDKSNYTHEKNQKVKFIIDGRGIIVDILPNPSRPNPKIGEPGKLELIDLKRSEAVNRVKDGGAIIRIAAFKPSDSTKLKLTLKVYDVVGNQVISAKNDNVFNREKNNSDSSNVMYLHYVWNLTNEKGMKVAPGHYKVIAWFDYSSPKYKDEKVAVDMGVKK